MRNQVKRQRTKPTYYTTGATIGAGTA